MTDPLSIALPDYVAKDYSFPRKSVDVAWGPMHCVDTGGKGRPVLMLHGNPTWSYLYRKVMTALSDTQLRLIAPDLIGFGLSHKPADWQEHSLRRHGQSILQFVEKQKLKNIILVVQDWGGPIGGWMAAHAGNRVNAVVIMNTSLFLPRQFKTTPFHRFSHAPIVSDLAFRGIQFPVRYMRFAQGDRGSISKEAQKAYLWPMRELKDRAGPLALARMVPNSPDHPTMADLRHVDAWIRAFKGPIELVWGTKDPILGRALNRHRDTLAKARVTETDAGHFLQEEVPDEIAAAIRRLAGE